MTLDLHLRPRRTSITRELLINLVEKASNARRQDPEDRNKLAEVARTTKCFAVGATYLVDGEDVTSNLSWNPEAVTCPGVQAGLASPDIWGIVFDTIFQEHPKFGMGFYIVDVED